MDELGDKLNAILENPGQLERLTQAAKSIMGGEAQQGSAQGKNDLDFLDPSMLKKLGSFMSRGGAHDDKRVLLEAMKPYLSEKRQKKLNNAMKLAKLASIAEVALADFKIDDD
ncbi:MAG: hypothetical protein EOM54_05460 [Clostridia bacterium]|nr:hypothetical protein [Clostridia bacterium]NCC69370.1 hypothetical protein [Clostridia bacterium]